MALSQAQLPLEQAVGQCPSSEAGRVTSYGNTVGSSGTANVRCCLSKDLDAGPAGEEGEVETLGPANEVILYFTLWASIASSPYI